MTFIDRYGKISGRILKYISVLNSYSHDKQPEPDPSGHLSFLSRFKLSQINKSSKQSSWRLFRQTNISTYTARLSSKYYYSSNLLASARKNNCYLEFQLIRLKSDITCKREPFKSQNISAGRASNHQTSTAHSLCKRGYGSELLKGS